MKRKRNFPEGYITGRPTDYDVKYCKMLEEHMMDGFSFESFGGIVGASKKTLFNWCDKHPEFLHSKEVGVAFCRMYYEELGAKALDGKIPFFNDRLYRLNMLNRFRDEWGGELKTEQNNKEDVNVKQDINFTLNLGDEPKKEE